MWVLCGWEKGKSQSFRLFFRFAAFGFAFCLSGLKPKAIFLEKPSVSEFFLADRRAQLHSRKENALFSKWLSPSKLMKQLAGDDALLLFCSFNSTTMFLCQDKPFCSFNKAGETTHDFPHFRLRASQRDDLGGKGQRVPPEGGNQFTNQNTLCLLKQLIKTGANPFLKMALAARKEIMGQTLASFPHAGTSCAVCCLVSIGVRAAPIHSRVTVFHTSDSHYLL